MRMLKDYMKLIFTAVVCFLMKFVSGKAKGSKVKVREKSGEYGNLIAVTEKNGLRETNEACTEKDRRMADQMAGASRQTSSPTTISRLGISTTTPLRNTFAVGADNCFRLFRECSAFTV